MEGNPEYKGQLCDSQAFLATELRNVLSTQARGSWLPWNNHLRVNIGLPGQRLNACGSQDIKRLQADTEEMSQRLDVFCCVFSSALRCCALPYAEKNEDTSGLNPIKTASTFSVQRPCCPVM